MATAKKGKTLADLRAVHDKRVLVPNKIRAGLERMVVAGDEWLYEADFMKLGVIGPNDIRDYRDQFANYWADMPATNGKSSARRVWFASPALCKKWKEL